MMTAVVKDGDARGCPGVSRQLSVNSMSKGEIFLISVGLSIVVQKWEKNGEEKW